MNHDEISAERRRTNLTAADCYAHEGLGIGAGGGALEVLEQRTTFQLTPGMDVLEIGCASLQLAEVVLPRGASYAGVDIRVDRAHVRGVAAKLDAVDSERLLVEECDVSRAEAALMKVPDQYDAAFCTETIEHLSDPYFMFAQVKRALRHGGAFVLAFPMPEDNLGFEGGKHAHVYPGFLTRASFELFARQLYFKIVHRHSNGSSAWYVLANYKGPGVVDVFSMTTGNYEETELFRYLDAYAPPFQARP